MEADFTSKYRTSYSASTFGQLILNCSVTMLLDIGHEYQVFKCVKVSVNGKFWHKIISNNRIVGTWRDIIRIQCYILLSYLERDRSPFTSSDLLPSFEYPKNTCQGLDGHWSKRNTRLLKRLFLFSSLSSLFFIIISLLLQWSYFPMDYVSHPNHGTRVQVAWNCKVSWKNSVLVTMLTGQNRCNIEANRLSSNSRERTTLTWRQRLTKGV